MPSVCRTHVSGERETRQSNLRILWPWWRPRRNQRVSASTVAKKAARRSFAKGSRPSAARAPATTSVGTAGTGSPSCSRRTFRKTKPVP
jgi:hypothetical protein